MWIYLLALPFLAIAACNRNDFKNKKAEPIPNPIDQADIQDSCEEKFLIEHTYRESQTLNSLLDGKKYLVQRNEVVENPNGKNIDDLMGQSSFPSGIHFSNSIQGELNQLEGKKFYFCMQNKDRPVSFHRFANHYNDLLIAKNLYSGLEADSKFKSPFLKDKVGCSLKRTTTEGSHSEKGRTSHNSSQPHAHDILQSRFDECVDLSE